MNVLIGKLAESDKVKHKFQRADAATRSARACFDKVLVNYPDISVRLDPVALIVQHDPVALIVQHPSFESEILKVQNGHEGPLTTV